MMVLHFIFFATLLKTWKCLHFLEKAKELAHLIQPANSHLWLGHTLYSANQSLNPMWFLFFWVSPKRSLRFPLAPSAKVAKQYFDCGHLVHFRSHQFYFQNLVTLVSGRDFNHTPIWAASLCRPGVWDFQRLGSNEPQESGWNLAFFSSLPPHIYTFVIRLKFFVFPPA